MRFFFVFYSAFIIKYGYDNNDNLQESNVNAIFLYCCFFFLHSHCFVASLVILCEQFSYFVATFAMK